MGGISNMETQTFQAIAIFIWGLFFGWILAKLDSRHANKKLQ